MKQLNQALSPKTAALTIKLDDAERQPCEIWTRVMGYHRPVTSFNTGKKGEFYERTYYSEQRANLAA
ncbi:MAG: anaerobic ribonucleoside-triphosphate reductase [Undibacterium sp.]|jgi:anaerobic ribonucleoside-triphosphate reductase|uniref:anaerobic ribonucleoside-triphosphate reductase n=1 Tax=Undibacterium sp. TaxID=1914977 RepID=UPI0027191356|nr:anaerobic ribonucleoside-triphosphate reductase [Undibacterium sp.]MDO8652527.1 anaerobic ribonucleoside-triphosphate reductase [Undibacterium sp.]